MEIPQNLNSLGSKLPEDKQGPTTSNPINSSNNMNDLKMLDFNSADEVRQAMKVMLAGKAPLNAGDELSIKPTQVKESSAKGPPGDEAAKPVKEEAEKEEEVVKTPIITSNTVQNMANAVFKLFSTTDRHTFPGSVQRKRPGRPPKAGPSKRIKKASVTSLYIGKLSNVVKFKHHTSDSESDDFFY